MSKFEADDYLKESVEKRDFAALHNILYSILNTDKSFSTTYFDDTLKYITDRIPDFVKENDEQESFKDKLDWKEDDWMRIAASLKDNFTMEKVELLKRMSEVLYPVKKEEDSAFAKYLPIAVILGVIAMGVLILLLKK